jgi:hypothetical protein
MVAKEQLHSSSQAKQKLVYTYSKWKAVAAAASHAAACND